MVGINNGRECDYLYVACSGGEEEFTNVWRLNWRDESLTKQDGDILPVRAHAIAELPQNIKCEDD